MNYLRGLRTIGATQPEDKRLRITTEEPDDNNNTLQQVQQPPLSTPIGLRQGHSRNVKLETFAQGNYGVPRSDIWVDIENDMASRFLEDNEDKGLHDYPSVVVGGTSPQHQQTQTSMRSRLLTTLRNEWKFTEEDEHRLFVITEATIRCLLTASALRIGFIQSACGLEGCNEQSVTRSLLMSLRELMDATQGTVRVDALLDSPFGKSIPSIAEMRNAIVRTAALFVRMVALINWHTPFATQESSNDAYDLFEQLGTRGPDMDFLTSSLVEFDVLVNVPLSREYVYAASANFFESPVNDLGRFLDRFDVNVVSLDMFRKLSKYGNMDQIHGFLRVVSNPTPPEVEGVTRDPEVTKHYRTLLFKYMKLLDLMNDPHEAVKRTLSYTKREEFEVDQASAQRIAKTAKIPLPQAHDFARSRLSTRQCERCVTNALCDSADCTDRPYLHVRVRGHRDKTDRNFVCGPVFGHLCKRCRIRAEARELVSGYSRVTTRDGGQLFHVNMRRMLFDVVIHGVTHRIDTTGTLVRCDTLEKDIAPNTASTQVKILVRVHPDKREEAVLRVGRTTERTLWPVQLQTIRVIQEPVFLALKGEAITIRDHQDNVSELDFCNREIVARMRESPLHGLQSTSAYYVRIVSAFSPRLPITDEEVTERVRANSGPGGREVIRRFITAGTLSEARDVDVANIRMSAKLIQKKKRGEEMASSVASGGAPAPAKGDAIRKRTMSVQKATAVATSLAAAAKMAAASSSGSSGSHS